MNKFYYIVLIITLINIFKSDAGNDNTLRSDSTYSTDYSITGSAIEYYKNLTALLADFKQSYYNYIRSVTRTRKIRAIENSRQKLLRVIQENIKLFKKSSSFQNDETLKTELIRFMDLVDIILTEDFGKILDMEDIAAQSYDQAEAHQLALDLAVDKLKSCSKIMTKAEEQFFNKYNIKMLDKKDELSLKIEKANKALAYYDSLYRIFFKANKQDSYARKAISENDVAALEQHISTLKLFVDEGLDKLNNIKGFNGDEELLLIVRKILEFYRNQALVTYPANVGFIINSDNFQKVVKKFNSIKESERKQSDIDLYNNAVKQYNAEVKSINKTNQVSYKTHNQFLEMWNKQVEKFFEKHS